MQRYHNDRNIHLSLGVVFGIIAGIGVGLLMAPRSGKDTRSQIRERAMAARQSAHNRIVQGRAAAAGALNSSLETSKDVADKAANAAADKTKEAASTTSRKAKAAASRAQAGAPARTRSR